jgi:hypothetical protein
MSEAQMGGLLEAAPPAAMHAAAGDGAAAETGASDPAAHASGSNPGESASDASGSGPLAAIVVRRGGEGDNEGPDALTRDAPRPLLIYTASMAITVDHDEIAATIDRVIEEAVQLGGYLATRDDRSVQVRIPSASFREGLGAIEQMGEVTSRSVNAQDVTEEYHDAEVRLQNLRAIRDRLEQFLARATNIEEVLRVHTELERVSREIDTIEGRLRFLRARVAFSMVTVSLTARPIVVAVVDAEPPPPGPPPPPARPDLPFEWLSEMGMDRVLNLTQED